MSKADVIDTLVESAITVFAREGYEGASLREIAGEAGVALSAINLYFGTKMELFISVTKTVYAEIDQERRALFRAAEERFRPDPIPMADLIHALAFPVVRHALSEDPHELDKLKLLVSHLSMISPMIDVIDRAVVPWIEAMGLLYPTLTREDRIWAFSYFTGTIYSWQLLNHRYDKMLGAAGLRSISAVTDEIVAFCSGGLSALVEQHQRAAERQAD